MDVFDLYASLGLDTSSYEEGLGRAEQQGSNFGAGLRTAAGIGAAAIAATTTAVVAGSVAFANGVGDVAEYADNIDKMSQKLGMSAESYQEWDFVMQHAGTSIESMQASMKTLASAAETGNEAFEALGFTQEELASMSQEDLFANTIAALQNVEDETQRTYLAGQLLGRGATELGPLLNMSAEEVENMRQQVHDLGGVMSDEAVAAGAQYQDSLQNMQTALAGVRNNLLGEFLPSFSTVMDGLSAIFSGDQGGLELVRQGVNDFADQMNETLPVFVELAGNIIEILGSAIIENLPTLIDVGADVIGQLADGIIDHLPELVSSAIDIIGRITMGLIEAAPELLSAAIEIIQTLGTQLVENLPTMMSSITDVIVELVTLFTEPENLSMLIDLSLQLIIAVADGLVQAAPQLASAVPVIIGNLITTVINEFPKIIETVGTLIGDLGMVVLGLVGGLMGMSYDEVVGNLELVWEAVGDFFTETVEGFTEFVSDVTGFVSGLWQDIGAFFTDGITNVGEALSGWWDELSEWFGNLADNALTWAGDMIDNFVQGIMNGVGAVGDAVSSIADTIADIIGFSEPEIGPLSNFHTFAPDMIQLFSQGIEQSMPVLEGAVNEMSEYVADNMPSYSVNDITSSGTATVDANGLMRPIVIPVYVGNEKIDELVVDSNQRTAFISGGRA